MKINRFRPALRRLLPLLLLAGLPAACSQTTPNPPSVMSFQGYLTDGNGNALGAANTGPKNYTVVFRIFDSQSGNNKIDTEQQTVTVNNGYFSVQLGLGTQYGTETQIPLASVFTSPSASSRFVEMTVLGIGAGGNAVTLAPRLQLVSSPYAFLAANAVNATTLVNTNGNGPVVTVSGNGNVGIGTSTPNAPLEVVGNADFDGVFTSSGGAYFNNYATFNNSALFNSTATFHGVATFSANVGIGTASPGYSLEVNGTAGLDSSLTVGGSIAMNNGQEIGAKNASGNLENFLWPRWTDNVMYLNYGSAGFNVRNDNSTSAMFMQANGNVGIGTTTPNALLEVSGNAMVDGYNFTLDNAINMYVGYNATGNRQLWFEDAALTAGSSANPVIRLQPDATTIDAIATDGQTALPLNLGNGKKVTIATSGNVGIGTTSPARTLDVVGQGGFTSTLILDSTAAANWTSGVTAVNSGNGIQFGGPTSGEGIISSRLSSSQNQYGIDFVTAGYARMVVNNSGNIGIGTTAPKYPLDVETSITANNYTLPANFGFLNSSGQSSGNGANSYGTTVSIYAAYRIVAGAEFDAVSDARVKEVVGRSNTRNDLATVRQLQITDYRKVDKVQFGGRLEKGVIAQEVEAIVPQAVTTSTNFIPNIYALAQSIACTNQNLWVTMDKPHGLVVGDVVKLMTETGEIQTTVTAVKSTVVFAVVQPDKMPEHLFVFGKQVSDFRAVNYDRLFTTGLGAIQELAKRADAADARADRLAKQVDELTARAAHVVELERQAAQVDGLAKEVADLKKLVAQLADVSKKSKWTASVTPGESAPSQPPVWRSKSVAHSAPSLNL